MKVCRVEEMRQMDKRAIEEFGIPDAILMENAGNASFYIIRKNMPVKNKRFVVFCGGGNNGGDGLVVARKLHSNGAKVTVFLLSNPQKFKNSAAANYKIALNLGLTMSRLKNIGDAEAVVAQADAIVDALFGTGLDRKVEGNYYKTIELINNADKPVFSIDIPSGINGNSGRVMGIAVQAHFTTTYGQPKLGNLLYPGFSYGGHLSVTHISFPPRLHSDPSLLVEVNDLLPLPNRKADGHKGSFGKALFIAGSSLYLGAPYFAALSYLKAGGGLSFLAAPSSIAAHIAAKGSEIILRPQPTSDYGSLAMQSKESILELSESVDFVVIGPGLSPDEQTQQLIRVLVPRINKPLLIDGDGLSAIAPIIKELKSRKYLTILTPHIAEMSRISGETIEKIEKDKISLLQKFAAEWHSIIVLKGAHSLIGLPDRRVYINLSGNSGMATAGSGDVLTGTIAALFGYGLDFPLEDAVRMGVFIHGLAGDLAAREKGEDGITAEDILQNLPFALKEMRSNFEDIAKDYYHKIEVI